MTEKGEPVLLPPNPAEYLTKWLFEIGPAVPAGMGMAAIGWPEIKAWQETMGVQLHPWEARILRTISQAFVTQSREARERGCPAPFAGAPIDEDQRAVVARGIKAMFGGLRKAEE